MKVAEPTSLCIFHVYFLLFSSISQHPVKGAQRVMLYRWNADTNSQMYRHSLENTTTMLTRTYSMNLQMPYIDLSSLNKFYKKC